MDEGTNIDLDADWFKKNRIRGISRRLDWQIQRDMDEVEKLLKDYLVVMLDLTHRRLIDGRISLSNYHRDTQMLACCAQRLNGEGE